MHCTATERHCILIFVLKCHSASGLNSSACGELVARTAAAIAQETPPMPPTMPPPPPLLLQLAVSGADSSATSRRTRACGGKACCRYYTHHVTNRIVLSRLPTRTSPHLHDGGREEGGDGAGANTRTDDCRRRSERSRTICFIREMKPPARGERLERRARRVRKTQSSITIRNTNRHRRYGLSWSVETCEALAPRSGARPWPRLSRARPADPTDPTQSSKRPAVSMDDESTRTATICNTPPGELDRHHCCYNCSARGPASNKLTDALPIWSWLLLLLLHWRTLQLIAVD
jgi:hypothetical protein